MHAILGMNWLQVAESCCQEIVLHSPNLAHSFQTSGKNIVHTHDTVTCLETVTKINSQYVPAVVCDVPPASLLISYVILLLNCGRVVTVRCKLVRLATIIEGLTNDFSLIPVVYVHEARLAS